MNKYHNILPMQKALFVLILVMCSFFTSAQDDDYVKISADFLQKLKDEESTKNEEVILSKVSIDDLANNLNSDTRRKAFWINIYNGYIIKILRLHPEYYDDRSTFFKKEQIPIIQRKLSFADIEHGILRHSQFEYFLGYITNPFAPSYEKILRVKDKDFRIHFALNCGAKDCPPVAIFTEENYESIAEENTGDYLIKVSKYISDDRTVHTTPLMSWFRGDFGGKSGIIDILERHEVVPLGQVSKIVFKDYDWTLDLDNFK